MQNYHIRCITLYNWLDKGFHLLDSSSYKRSKSGIAFLQTGINSFLLMPFTILVPNTYGFRPKRTTSLSLVYPGIRFLLYLKTLSVSLSGNRFTTGVGLLLRVVALLSILLLNAFLNSLTSLFI